MTTSWGHRHELDQARREPLGAAILRWLRNSWRALVGRPGAGRAKDPTVRH